MAGPHERTPAPTSRGMQERVPLTPRDLNHYLTRPYTSLHSCLGQAQHRVVGEVVSILIFTPYC